MSTYTTERDADGVEWLVIKCRSCGAHRRGARVLRLSVREFEEWNRVNRTERRLLDIECLLIIVLMPLLIGVGIVAHFISFNWFTPDFESLFPYPVIVSFAVMFTVFTVGAAVMTIVARHIQRKVDAHRTCILEAYSLTLKDMGTLAVLPLE